MVAPPRLKCASEVAMSRVSRVYVGAARAGNGTRGGLYRRITGEGGWERLSNGLPDETQVQAITVHPDDPDVVYAGTHDGPYRSEDGGDSWRKLPMPAPPERVRMDFPTRVMRLAVDPANPEHIYATLEVG